MFFGSAHHSSLTHPFQVFEVDADRVAVGDDLAANQVGAIVVQLTGAFLVQLREHHGLVEIGLVLEGQETHGLVVLGHDGLAGDQPAGQADVAVLAAGQVAGLGAHVGLEKLAPGLQRAARQPKVLT